MLSVCGCIVLIYVVVSLLANEYSKYIVRVGAESPQFFLTPNTCFGFPQSYGKKNQFHSAMELQSSWKGQECM